MAKLVMLGAGHLAPWGKLLDMFSEVTARKLGKNLSVKKYRCCATVSPPVKRNNNAIVKDEGGSSHIVN